jgi:hypothetical protein
MKPLIRRYFGLSALTIGFGSVAAVWGTHAIVRFINDPIVDGEPTLAQMTKGIVLPHFCALLGLGITVYGVILLVKALVFTSEYLHRRRMSTRV